MKNLNLRTRRGVVCMPRKDGTGPRGEGPMTGLGMGRCCDYSQNRGGGFGYRRFQRLSDDEKREALKEEARFLKEDLETVEKELSELDQ